MSKNFNSFKYRKMKCFFSSLLSSHTTAHNTREQPKHCNVYTYIDYRVTCISPSGNVEKEAHSKCAQAGRSAFGLKHSIAKVGRR